jgi:hypothetical protein
MVVRTGEQHLDLRLADANRKLPDGRANLGLRLRVVGGELEQHAGVVDSPAEPLGFFDAFLKAAALLQELLRLLLIVPQLRVRNPVLDLFEVALLPNWVKETSEVLRRVTSGFRTAIAHHRAWSASHL